MQSFQTVTIGGHLGNDAEQRYTQDGVMVIRFNVAVGWRRPNRDNKDEWEDKTSWYSVSLTGRRAESQAPRLTKGTAVVVTGRLQPDIWIDRNNESRLDLNLFAFDVVIADRSERQDDGNNGDRPARRQEPAAARQERRSNERVDDLEDLPF
jgi:single-strand DNA-binding protein